MDARNSRYIGLVFLGAMAIRLLLGSQGIDAIDLGFSATFYQSLFSHPEAMPYNYCYYLTGLFGALWTTLFSSWGVWGLRLLEALTHAGAIAFIYFAFRSWLPPTRTALWAIALSFCFPATLIVFHYNTLSFFFVAISTYAFMRWLKNLCWKWLFLSGFLIGVSFFARIINGSLAVLALMPMLYAGIQEWKRGFWYMTIHAVGIGFGSLMVVGLLCLIGHWPYFLMGMQDAFHIFTEDVNSHASGHLTVVYLKSFVNIALQMAALLALYASYGWTEKQSESLRKWLRGLIIIILFVLVFTSLPYLSVLAVATLLCLWYWHQGVDRELKVLLAYVVVGAYLLPFGSDIGIPGVFHWYAGLLIIPAATIFTQLTQAWAHRIAQACYACVLIAVMALILRPAYGEEENRLSTFHTPALGNFNVMTTPARAERYDHEITCIQQYSQDTPYLILANQASELYYATGKLPFTGNTQMETFMDEELLLRLDRQLNRLQTFPSIVWIEDGHDDPKPQRFRQTLSSWMQKNQYQSVYKDNVLLIFRTKKNIPDK